MVVAVLTDDDCACLLMVEHGSCGVCQAKAGMNGRRSRIRTGFIVHLEGYGNGLMERDNVVVSYISRN